MKLKKILKQKKFLVFFALFLLLGIIFYFTQKYLVYKNAASFSANIEASYDNQEKILLRINIPTINVDAAIESVGLTVDGSVDVPKGPSDVAWYNLGTYPGKVGSSVISGHSGWKNNTPAVFDDLHKIKIGDQIHIEDDKGNIVTFVVTRFHTYGPSESAPDVFISNDGKSHLNLVTCTGFWNKILKSHSSRLVVFTDKVID